MYNKDNKFKITATLPNGDKTKYLYSYDVYEGYEGYEISKKLFYFFMKMNWPSFEYEMNKTYTDKELQNQKLKENKERYLKLVQEFLGRIVDNNIFIGNSIKWIKEKWNWKLDDIRVKEFTWIKGIDNKKEFNLLPDSIISIKTPSFKVDKDSGKKECMFEENLLNANFYLENFIWTDRNRDKPNPYLTDKEFVKKIEDFIREAQKCNLTFQNVDKIYEDIKNSLLEDKDNQWSNNIYKISDNFKHIRKRLLEDVIGTYDNKLSIAEYKNIDEFVFIVKDIDDLENSKHYTIPTILNNFKNFLINNEYLKKFYVNSLSKEELAEIMKYKELGDNEKANELSKTALFRFFEKNQKQILDLWLENNIFSVNIKEDILKNTREIEALKALKTELELERE